MNNPTAPCAHLHIGIDGVCQDCGAQIEAYSPVPADSADERELGTMCQRCQTRYKVDVLVPDELWHRIAHGMKRMCSPCIFTLLEYVLDFDAFNLSESLCRITASPESVTTEYRESFTTHSIQPTDIHLPSGRHQLCGVEIRDDLGFFVGVANEHRFVQRLNNFEKLFRVLDRYDAKYLLNKMHDEGYLEAEDAEFILFSNLWSAIENGMKGKE